MLAIGTQPIVNKEKMDSYCEAACREFDAVMDPPFLGWEKDTDKLDEIKTKYNVKVFYDPDLSEREKCIVRHRIQLDYELTRMFLWENIY